MSLSDFDPLTSPANSSSASSVSSSSATPSSASSVSAAAAGGSSSSPSKAAGPAKFDSIDFLFASKWRSLHADLTHTITLAFEKPRPKAAAAAHAGEDAVAKALREKAEKEAADREKADREREEEQARQDEAKAAAAAGKEAIAADTKIVELPGSLPGVDGAVPSSAAGASASSSAARPASAADKLRELSLNSHEHDVNRYADKSTFIYKSTENAPAASSASADAVSAAAAPSVPSGVEYTGAFALAADKSSVTLSDVQKSVIKSGAPAVKSDVSGSFTLALAPEGKKVSGQLDGHSLEFELVDTSSEASLAFLF